MDLTNKLALVIGMGMSGRSAARLLLHHGAKVIGIDQNTDQEYLKSLPQSVEVCVDLSVNDFRDIDLIIISPGIAKSHPMYQKALLSQRPIMGEVELAAQFINQPCVGITGTNGKTTVTLLVTHVLNTLGIKAHALGNVGLPVAEELIKLQRNDEVLVLELSSYQLETLKTPILNAAVILNITPDHLDRYQSMDAYASAKWHIQDVIKSDGPLYVHDETFKHFGAFSKGKIYKYGASHDCDLIISSHGLYNHTGKIFDFPETLPSKLSHEHQNLVAAFLLCRTYGVSGSQFLEAYQTFQKPPHRVEFVRELKGISFVNDSKGTNIDAVIRAVEIMPGRVILIAGGVDKGSPYTPWIESFSGKVVKVCAIGEAAEKIEKDLITQIPVERFHDLADAVNAAMKIAKPGDTILLSPGCSSFDMFRDYAHRGDEFKRIVQEL